MNSLSGRLEWHLMVSLWLTVYRNLQEFIARGWLVQEDRPSYYIYAQKMGEHLQVGNTTMWSCLLTCMELTVVPEVCAKVFVVS